MVSAISAGGDAMTPNGRRAWRQRAKRNRWKPYDWNVIRRHRWIVSPAASDPVIAVKPFTPRSLVGMTMGARKRRARGLVGDLGHMLYGDYRIGQRIGPCPGCSLCKGVGCYACYPKFDQDCDACVNGMSCLCDGSGVLPAKRSTP